jgi:hypothetical protein
MNDETTAHAVKAPFEPPRLVAIELVAEEVLGNACKLDIQVSLNDSKPCAITVCAARGS